MAEHSFQEVMREWVRARKAIDQNKLSNCPLEMFTDDYIANIEKEVMAWAAEHPVVYPTWREWLLANRIIGDADSDYATGLLVRCKRIPADIAQKLGIQPKEG